MPRVAYLRAIMSNSCLYHENLNDIYEMQAIFSDDSDDEEENAGVSSVADPGKKIEGVNTTLNRLVAGDFLESLGKELGLEVPPESLPPVNKTTSFASLIDEKVKDSLNVDKENSVTAKETASAERHLPDHANTIRKDKTITFIRGQDDGEIFDHKENRNKAEKREHRSRKHRSHRHSSTSDTDSSNDDGRNERSKSRSEKRSSSKRKRKHLDHHSRKRSRSPSRYSSRDKDRDLSDDDRKDRRSRDKEKYSHKKHH